ncbi:MAG: hypothetical protein ACO2ZN_01085 [Paracoccaceae bacterium]
MFDHWRLLRGEKAVKLMVPKDPNDIAREKRSIGWDWTQSVSRVALSGCSVVGFAR